MQGLFLLAICLPGKPDNVSSQDELKRCLASPLGISVFGGIVSGPSFSSEVTSGVAIVAVASRLFASWKRFFLAGAGGSQTLEHGTIITGEKKTLSGAPKRRGFLWSRPKRI